MEKRRLFIVEDIELLRDVFKAMIEGADGWEVVGEAGDGLTAIDMILRLAPDLVLLDLSIPRMSGFSVLRKIKSIMPDIKMLVLSVYEHESYVLEAFRAGADGYAIKDASRDEMMFALREVLAGRRYVHPSIALKTFTGFGKERTQLRIKSGPEKITNREKEILKLIGEGYQNKAIARMLNISPKTVEKHRANIMEKLDLHNVSLLTGYAIQTGLVAARA